jgi:acyl-CoA reductase-like NAD-dependent aldehyde dehydrogenase
MQVPIWRSRHGLSIKLRGVDRDTVICDTWDVTDPVQQARAALDRAEAAMMRKREELAKAVAEAVGRGEKLSHVGVKARYTPEHVRRIARAHGVDATVDRTPPPPRTKVTEPFSE